MNVWEQNKDEVIPKLISLQGAITSATGQT